MHIFSQSVQRLWACAREFSQAKSDLRQADYIRLLLSYAYSAQSAAVSQFTFVEWSWAEGAELWQHWLGRLSCHSRAHYANCHTARRLIATNAAVAVAVEVAVAVVAVAAAVAIVPIVGYCCSCCCCCSCLNLTVVWDLWRRTLDHIWLNWQRQPRQTANVDGAATATVTATATATGIGIGNSGIGTGTRTGNCSSETGNEARLLPDLTLQLGLSLFVASCHFLLGVAQTCASSHTHTRTLMRVYARQGGECEYIKQLNPWFMAQTKRIVTFMGYSKYSQLHLLPLRLFFLYCFFFCLSASSTFSQSINIY